MQLSVNPEVVHGFEVSRRKVVEALSNMNFAKIVSIVQLPNKLDPSEPHFQGEVEEVFASKHRTAPRHAFFSRFARNTQGVSVLGCFTIVDTPMGTCQASALPQLGDVLVGSFVEAGRKGKIPFEFKGWCNNGKPLLELLRVLQFGTRMSSKELHTLLRQPASITASFALRLNANTSASQRRHAQKVSQCVDDIWNIARALCFKDLSLDESLKTSVSHWDMMTQLAMVTLDEEFLDYLNKIKPASEMFVPDPVEYSPSIVGYGVGAYGVQAQGYGMYGAHVAGTTLPQASDFGSKTPEYYPAGGGKTPPYVASSPSFLPSSPAYAPSSPKSKSPPRLISTERSVHSNSEEDENDKEPGIAGKSPQYSARESPKYSPESPKSPIYSPGTPVYSPESPKKSAPDILGMLPKFDDFSLPDKLYPPLPPKYLSTAPPIVTPAPLSEITQESISNSSTTASTTFSEPLKKQLKPTSTRTRKVKEAEMEIINEESIKKEPAKRKRVSKSTPVIQEPNPVLYSPTPILPHSANPENSKLLYSPSSVPLSPAISVPLSPAIQQHPFSPTSPAHLSNTQTSGKSILGSLLAKINSPRPVKMDIVSYEDI